MARQADNQIQPVARPVQAFIEPVRVSVAEPMRPAQLPAFRQPGVVQVMGGQCRAGVLKHQHVRGALGLQLPLQGSFAQGQLAGNQIGGDQPARQRFQQNRADAFAQGH